MDYASMISAGITAVGEIVKLINNFRETAKQNKELTPEQDAELDAKFKATFAQSHWDFNANK